MSTIEENAAPARGRDGYRPGATIGRWEPEDPQFWLADDPAPRGRLRLVHRLRLGAAEPDQHHLHTDRPRLLGRHLRLGRPLHRRADPLAGGRPADRVGGARCTTVSFVEMGAPIVVVINALPSGGSQGNFWIFYAGFLCAFFFVPAMFALFPVTGSLRVFVGFYAVCLTVCWWSYARRGAEAPS